MSDITTLWVATHGDWGRDGASLASGEDLATAVVLSLFTDRQATADDALPDRTADRRGWWGDEGQYLVGSRLWLLDRAKRTQETLALAQGYIAEALQWLIDDGVVARFSIFVEWSAQHTLGAQVIAHRNDGTTRAMNFAWAWTGSD